MALTLSVPIIEDNPAFLPEIRVQVLRNWVGQWLENPSIASAKAMLEAISILNRRKVRSDVRIKLLEVYRPCLLELVAQLSETFSGKNLPLEEEALKTQLICTELLSELAFGYKQSMLSRVDRLITFDRGRVLAKLIQRTLHTLYVSLQMTYLCYASPAKGLWKEIHHLYLYAVRQRVHEIAVEDRGVTTQINLAYKRLLLLSVATPNHLSRCDFPRVLDYLDRFSHEAQLHSWGSLEYPANAFLIRSFQDTPPEPLTKFKGQPNPDECLLLSTVVLSQRLLEQIKLLGEGESLLDLGLPKTEDRLEYQHFLSYLLKQWSLSPKRIFSRASRQESVSICVGMSAFIDMQKQVMLPPQFTDQPPIGHQGARFGVNFRNSLIDALSSKHYRSRWLLTNESASGLALSKFPGASPALSVGELIGIRHDPQRQWHLGVVRWASSNGAGELEMGAELLAPEARVVNLHLGSDSNQLTGLMLPEILPLTLPATILVERGILTPSQTIKVSGVIGKQESTLVVGRLMERTVSFDRFQFALR